MPEGDAAAGPALARPGPVADGAHLGPWSLLPALLMGVCMAVAFSIGSSCGTYAVVFPLAMPLAYAVSPEPFYVTLCFGAVLGGAVFGDQCSPISDTTLLAAFA